jgi:drug/metabolite transporter (DMT)-like permease
MRCGADARSSRGAALWWPARDPVRAPPMTPSVRSPKQDNIPLGILYMVGSSLVFAAVNGIIKWEVALYPVGEVAFYRSLFALIPCYLLILPRTGMSVLITSRWKDHAMRAVSQFSSMMCIFLAFQMMPLAGAIAISFAAPLFTTLLSAVVLREAVGVHRWSALMIGFCGVLFVTKPGAGSLQLGALFALANAVLISTVAVAIRRMSVTESTETLIVYQLSALAVLTALLLPLGYRSPSRLDLGFMAVAGIGNGFAQYWWTRALHVAPPSAVAPFNYLSLVWATIIGYLVWGDLPTRDLLIGSAIVVGSGLYILWRETVRRRARLLAEAERVGMGPAST